MPAISLIGVLGIVLVAIAPKAQAIAINAFGERGPDAALVVVMADIIPVQSAAWYVRFTDRIFGAPSAGPHPRAKQDCLPESALQASSGEDPNRFGSSN